MANRYPGDLAHSDDEAPRSRCSSRSDRETRESDSDADRARREQASDAARWSRGLLKTGDQRAAPSRGLPIITFTWTPFGVRKSHDIRVMLWINVAMNVLFCEWVEAKLLYEDDCDRDSPPCGIERRARYAAHAGGLLAGAALGYFL